MPSARSSPRLTKIFRIQVDLGHSSTQMVTSLNDAKPILHEWNDRLDPGRLLTLVYANRQDAGWKLDVDNPSHPLPSSTRVVFRHLKKSIVDGALMKARKSLEDEIGHDDTLVFFIGHILRQALVHQQKPAVLHLDVSAPVNWSVFAIAKYIRCWEQALETCFKWKQWSTDDITCRIRIWNEAIAANIGRMNSMAEDERVQLDLEPGCMIGTVDMGSETMDVTVTEQKRDQWKVHAHIGLDLGASSINSHATQLAQQFIRDQVDPDNVDDALLTFEHTTFEYFEKPMLHEGSREILYDNYRKLPRAVCEDIRIVFKDWVNEVLDAIAAFFGKHNAKVILMTGGGSKSKLLQEACERRSQDGAEWARKVVFTVQRTAFNDVLWGLDWLSRNAESIHFTEWSANWGFQDDGDEEDKARDDVPPSYGLFFGLRGEKIPDEIKSIPCELTKLGKTDFSIDVTLVTTDKDISGSEHRCKNTGLQRILMEGNCETISRREVKIPKLRGESRVGKTRWVYVFFVPMAESIRAYVLGFRDGSRSDMLANMKLERANGFRPPEDLDNRVLFSTFVDTMTGTVRGNRLTADDNEM